MKAAYTLLLHCPKDAAVAILTQYMGMVSFSHHEGITISPETCHADWLQKRLQEISTKMEIGIKKLVKISTEYIFFFLNATASAAQCFSNPNGHQLFF